MTGRIDPCEWHDNWIESFIATDRAGVELRDNVEVESCAIEMIYLALQDRDGLKSGEAVALYNRICRELNRVSQDELRECQQLADEEGNE